MSLYGCFCISILVQIPRVPRSKLTIPRSKLTNHPCLPFPTLHYRATSRCINYHRIIKYPHLEDTQRSHSLALDSTQGNLRVKPHIYGELFTCLLNTNRLWAVTASLRNLCQCLNTHPLSEEPNPNIQYTCPNTQIFP